MNTINSIHTNINNYTTKILLSRNNWTTGSTTWVSPITDNISVLVVGSGGSTSSVSYSGGGGGGGVVDISNNSYNIVKGTTYTLIVGSAITVANTSGNPSKFGIPENMIVADGGGGGGGGPFMLAGKAGSINGYSGGGGGGYNSNTGNPTAPGAGGHIGFNHGAGGNAVRNKYGGGGGGGFSGVPGNNALTNVNGTTSNITGTEVMYARGGGGGGSSEYGNGGGTYYSNSINSNKGIIILRSSVGTVISFY